jgi:hypothetical protein
MEYPELVTPSPKYLACPVESYSTGVCDVRRHSVGM